MNIPMTYHEAAAERLREEIIAGVRGPGQRLKQSELAQQYGCSVIPIREALHTLAAEGFVVADPQKGARVADLNSMTLEEIYEIRMLMEGRAARRAAERMSELVAQQIRSILDKMDRPDITTTEWLTLNLEFHDSLNACADQEQLRKMIAALRRSLEPYLRLDLAKVADYQPGRVEHRRIFEACLRRDGNDAERHTIEHLRRSSDGLIRYLRGLGK
jgi:DNA-binding GntR family transcriptional regulator